MPRNMNKAPNSEIPLCSRRELRRIPSALDKRLQLSLRTELTKFFPKATPLLQPPGYTFFTMLMGLSERVKRWGSE
jgi:hypothetical protein